jgi:hypothetical protein
VPVYPGYVCLPTKVDLPMRYSCARQTAVVLLCNDACLAFSLSLCLLVRQHTNPKQKKKKKKKAMKHNKMLENVLISCPHDRSPTKECSAKHG